MKFKNARIRTAIKMLAFCLVLSNDMVVSTALAQEARRIVPTVFDDATELYRTGKYADAFKRFAALADRHDAESARIAYLMQRFGKQLYSAELQATPEQKARWLALASERVPMAGLHACNCDPPQ